MSHDERVTGDMPATPGRPAEEERPMVAEEVVARYVAETVRRIPGITELHGSALQELSEKVRVEVPTKGVAVHETDEGALEVDVHVRVAWGVSIPELAETVQEEVTRTVGSLLDLDVRRVTLFVDDIDKPGQE